MAISFEQALGPHAAALSLRSERVGVLANNLANADTPGFQARDVDFRQALAARLEGPEAQGGLRATHARHLPPSGQSLAAELAYRIPTLPSEDGNTVDTQIEQAQIAANNLETQVAMTFLGNRFQSLLTAVRGE
ncbi:MAG: flagellar basal body rod protein FlgB [Pseudomonadota bacterium]